MLWNLLSLHAGSGNENEQLKELLALLKEDLAPAEKMYVRKSIERHKLGTNKNALQQVQSKWVGWESNPYMPYLQGPANGNWESSLALRDCLAPQFLKWMFRIGQLWFYQYSLMSYMLLTWVVLAVPI